MPTLRKIYADITGSSQRVPLYLETGLGFDMDGRVAFAVFKLFFKII